VDKLNLPPQVMPVHPPHLPLPDHVHRFVSRNGAKGRRKLAKALLGFHWSLDRTMVVFKYVIQVLHRPVPAAPAQRTFLFHSCGGRDVEARLVRVDDSRLGVTDRLAPCENKRLAAAPSRRPTTES
jgi:hypothetical protein